MIDEENWILENRKLNGFCPLQLSGAFLTTLLKYDGGHGIKIPDWILNLKI